MSCHRGNLPPRWRSLTGRGGLSGRLRFRPSRLDPCLLLTCLFTSKRCRSRCHSTGNTEASRRHSGLNQNGECGLARRVYDGSVRVMERGNSNIKSSKDKSCATIKVCLCCLAVVNSTSCLLHCLIFHYSIRGKEIQIIKPDNNV